VEKALESNVIHLSGDEEPPVTFTDKAIIAVKEVMESEEVEGDGLRVYVQGGGCAGLQYGLDFSNLQDGDMVFEQGGLKVYVDCISAMHLEGTSIDFQMGIAGSGFKFNNPYATRTCGCGSSFY